MPATFFITAIRDTGADILWNDFIGMLGRYGPAKLMYKDEEFYKSEFNRYMSAKSGISLTEIMRSGDYGIKAEMIKSLYPWRPTGKNRLMRITGCK